MAKIEDEELTSQLYARVPAKLKKEFDGACRTKGLKKQYVVEKLVEMWISGEIELKDPE